jgi:hypothetical protein
MVLGRLVMDFGRGSCGDTEAIFISSFDFGGPPLAVDDWWYQG